MPVASGVFTPLDLATALNQIIAAAPSSIVFSPGNPPELILANMFAEAWVEIDENEGEIMASFLSPVGSMIDLMNQNNPRQVAVAANGYVFVSNPTGSAISIPPNTIFTAAMGQQYTTGVTALTVPAESGGVNGTLDVPVICTETGMGGNIPSGQSFTISGLSSLTGTNPIPFLNGAAAESDAIYLNRIISEKTEYGTQNGSVAVETEIKDYYLDAWMYVNNTQAASTYPIQCPANGYNLIVKTPSGILANAAEIAQIFTTLSNRLEFVNSQNTSDIIAGNTLHMVMGGSVLAAGVPLSYYFTVAQPVTTTIAITINVRASKNATTAELVTQANNFAVYFIDRMMQLFSGIDGNTNIEYIDSNNPSGITTSIAIAGASAQGGTIAPQFGIGTIEALVNDLSTMANTPQILFDSVSALSIVINPNVTGQSAVTLSLGGAKTFIDFKNDELFSDYTSFYDRYMFIDPTKITVTIQETAWM